ncbi:MAG: hypothetical protein LUE23_09015, partial [Lachnospiraceae bacterium]|nr:hypothetical protein [Lachnospiraceae bacterium]
MEKLRDIPKGTQALLVNYDYKTCMHTITSMYASGFRDVELFPYFGEGSYNPAIELAITPNEADRVPPGICRVIDVGESSVNMNSLYTIAEKLGVYEEFIAHEAAEARKEYYYISSSMERLLNDRENMSQKISTLIRLMDDGIIITDDAGRVYLCNEKAKHLMRGRTSVLIGFNILELLPELPLRNQQERLIRSADIDLVVSVVEIQMEDRLAGYIVSLKDFEETERKQHTIRSRLYGVEHNAKYTFQDIIGDSPAIRDCIE